MRSALRVFSDFDGTITRLDTLRCLVEHVGAGLDWYRETERLIRAGRLTLRAAIARDMATIRVPLADALAVVRREVALDDGFAAFAAWCTAEEVPLTVLSAGFEEIIRCFLPPHRFPDLDIRGNRFAAGSWECRFRDTTAFGHDKAGAVAAARAAGAWAVFVGDGISDEAPARVAHEVFARRGRPLVDFCRAEGIACREFDSFADVLAVLASTYARQGRATGDARLPRNGSRD